MTDKDLTILNLKIAIEHVPLIPHAASNISMTSFGGISDKHITELRPFDRATITNECGSSACFLGYMPLTDAPELAITDDDFDSIGNFCYHKYSSRLFPSLDRNDRYLGKVKSELWEYVFGSYNVNDLVKALQRAQDVVDAQTKDYRSFLTL